MLRAALMFAACLSLSACAGIRDRLFPGDSGAVVLPYRATLDRGEDGRDVTVTVEVAPDVPLETFRESARYPVTRYCIETYGASRADWTIDPATGDWAVTRTADTALLQARCAGR